MTRCADDDIYRDLIYISFAVKCRFFVFYILYEVRGVLRGETKRKHDVDFVRTQYKTCAIGVTSADLSVLIFIRSDRVEYMRHSI